MIILKVKNPLFCPIEGQYIFKKNEITIGSDFDFDINLIHNKTPFDFKIHLKVEERNNTSILIIDLVISGNNSKVLINGKFFKGKKILTKNDHITIDDYSIEILDYSATVFINRELINDYYKDRINKIKLSHDVSNMESKLDKLLIPLAKNFFK